MKKLKAILLLAAAAVGAIISVEPAASQDRPLRMVMASTPSFTWLPFLVARNVAFDALQKEIGRTVDVTYAPTTTPAILGLLAGDYDFGIAYVQHAIKAQAENKDLVVLLAMMDSPTAALVVRTDLSEIQSPADLKGKAVGVVGLGSGHHMIALAIADSAGLSADDVTYRSTGGISGWLPSLRGKRVDALIASEPTLSRILDEGIGRIMVDLHDRDTTSRIFKGPHPTVALVARREYVDANPKVTKAVVGAHLNALKWIAQKSPGEVLAVLPDDLKKQQGVEKILQRVLPAVSKDGVVSRDAVVITAKWLRQMGEIPASVTIDPAKISDSRFLK
ncbi:MAG: ABC transporter substrate-binding protein [Hyphomonadaceae bacterium]|jgi:NitT/TauT family transport system substrate-binding protein|nr:ABC transporter substrate-binding protein [Hyphomonadaceae bacterium]